MMTPKGFFRPTKIKIIIFLMLFVLSFIKIIVFTFCFSAEASRCGGAGETLLNALGWTFALPANVYVYSGLARAFHKLFYGPAGSNWNILLAMIEAALIIVANNLYRYFLACIVAIAIKKN